MRSFEGPRLLTPLGAALFLFAAANPAGARDPAEIVATPVLAETFEDNQREWKLGEKTWSGRISGGIFAIENSDDNWPAWSLISVNVSARRPAEILVDIAFRENDVASRAALEWGGSENGREAQYFRLAADGSYAIGQRIDGTDTDRTTGRVGFLVKAGAFNRLTLRVLGDRTAFFVNGRVIWIAPTVPLAGPRCGIWVAAPGSAEFDNFQLGYLRADTATVAGRLAAYQAAVGQDALVVLDVPALGNQTSSALEAALQNRAQEALVLVQANRFDEAAKVYREILARRPADGTAHAQLAWCLLNQGAVTDAANPAGLAVAIEPLSVSPRLIHASVAAARGDWASAEASLRQAYLLDHATELPAAMEQALVQYKASTPAATWVTEFTSKAKAATSSRDPAFAQSLNALARAEAALAQRAWADAEKSCQEATAAIREVGSSPEKEFLAACVYQAAGAMLGRSDDPRRSQPFWEEAFARLQRLTWPGATFVRARNAADLANLALQTSDTARAKDIVATALPSALTLPDAGASLKAELLLAGCAATQQLQHIDELRRLAQQLIQLRGTGDDPRFQALGYNFIGASYTASTLPPDRQKARDSFERALGLARQAGAGELANNISSNLAISYWQAGDRKRAREVYEDLAVRGERSGDFVGAEISLNNLGSMYYYSEDYASAAEIFRRAVELTEKARVNVSGDERIRLMAERLSAYQFLVACLQRTGDNAGLFEAENLLRARNLAQTLNLGAPPPAISLAKFQQGLAADETAVFYTLQGAGEIVAHVVSRDRAVPVHHADFKAFVGLKKRYLDRLNKGRPGYKPVEEQMSSGSSHYSVGDPATQISMSDFDSMVELTRSLIEPGMEIPPEVRMKLLQDFLGALRGLLIAPIEPHLAGRTKLLLFPDGILNFLPFELLPAADGSPLVQRFDVRYCQSAAVWQTLRDRHYDAPGRQPFFGMGGAIFHAMQETSPPAADQSRLVQLQIQAQRNTIAGKPQREVYAALFGSKPMNYLEGSLIEVQQLAKTFPAAVVFTGEEMTENRIKTMSRDGSLKKFGIIHLATHGFALPEVPELSGVAMSIFPTMQGDEDGYLTSPEIARLGMQADLAVLSACQTALGRIYGGEGVAGLTGALLVGGANRALVSLWPVSDAGTMRFMSELYTLTVAGKSYAEAVNTVKRAFISGTYGEDFREPYIWAPFVLYGP